MVQSVYTCAQTVVSIPPDPGYGCLGETTKLDEALIVSKKASGEDGSNGGERSQCFNLSGPMAVMLVFGLLLLILGRQYLRVILDYMESLDSWQSVLIFLVLFTIVSFPMTFGYLLLNLACGYLYGFWSGFFTVMGCVAFGVPVSVLVCRRWFRSFVRDRLNSDHLKAVMRVVEGRHGFRLVALTRLTPIPFGLQNGLFATTNISMMRCVGASVIGLLPTQALNTYMGTTLRNMEEVYSSQADSYVVLIIQVVITGFLLIYVIRRAKREINKACALAESEQVQLKSIEVKALQRTSSQNPLQGPPCTSHHKRSASASAIVVSSLKGEPFV